MTKVLQHSPSTEEISPGLFKSICGCGWKGKRYETKQTVAQQQADQHAALKGCGKRRLTKAEADQAVLDSRIARGVHGNARRREDRYYPCSTCPGDAWHLTSRR